jgi:hypothetical protein
MQIKVTLGNLLIAHFPFSSARLWLLVFEDLPARRVGTLLWLSSTNLAPKTSFNLVRKADARARVCISAERELSLGSVRSTREFIDHWDSLHKTSPETVVQGRAALEELT